MTFAEEKFDRNERRVLAFCLAGVLFLGYCLLTDKTFFYKSLSALGPETELLATVEKLENDVRYSPSHLPIWEGSYLKQNLFRRDKIFTEVASSATIIFLESSEIEVGESSLVIIDSVEGAPVVNLIKGSLRAKIGSSNDSLKILNNGREIKIIGNQAEVRIDVRNGQERVTALNGQVMVEGPNGLVTLNSNDSFVGSTGNKIPTSKAIRRRDGKIVLSWQNPDAELMNLEISGNSDFSNPVLAEETRDETYLYSPRRDGTYYWRVKNADGTRSSEVNTFEVRGLERPSQLTTRSYQAKENGRIVQKTEFAWSAQRISGDNKDNSNNTNSNEGATSASASAENIAYRLQVSQDPNFNDDGTYEEITVSNKIAVDDLAPGTYYWRVKNDQKGAAWSETQKLVVKDKSPEVAVKLNAALATQPKGLRTQVKQAYQSPEQPASATTQWRKVKGATQYEIEVSDSNQFVGPPVALETTASNKLEVNNLTPGTYFWRVRTVDEASGKKGPWSKARRFVIEDEAALQRARLIAEAKKSPTQLSGQLAAPVVAPDQTTSAELSWQKQASPAMTAAIGGTVAYETQIANNSQFTNPQALTSQNGENKVNVSQLAEGTYYWRVRTLLPDGSRGDWSQVKKLVVRKEKTSDEIASTGGTPVDPAIAEPTLPLAPVEPKKATKAKIKTEKKTLEAPTILYPQNKKVLDITGQKLEWNKVEGSNGYQLEVFNYKNPKQAIVNTTPEENALNKLDLKPGKYLWRVASISEDGVKTYSKKKTFIVKDIGAMKALEALKPDPNDRLTSSAIALVVDFLWLEDKRAAYYKIEASLSPDFLTTFFSQNVDSPEASFNFPQGTFYWRITSYDKDNKVIKQSKVNTFTVAATMGIPEFYGETNIAFQVSKQQASKDIDLTWSVVPQADRYEIELASDADFTEMQLSSSIIEPNLSLTLDLGKFYARVRAVDSYGFGSDWSKSKEIEITGTDLEPGPKLVLPQADANFIYRRNPVPISFRWKTFGKTANFDFQISKNQEFRNFEIYERTEKRMLIQSLAEGEYYWRVRSYDLDNVASNWSESRRIIVTKEESAVALTFPVDGKEVVRFGQGKMNLSFKWNAPKDITQFTVLVAKDENFTEILAKKNVKGETVTTLEFSHDGDTFWLVEGENIKENFKVRSSTGKFKVISPSDKRWDKNGKVALGVKPSQGVYSSDGGESQASMVSGLVSGKYWLNDLFGLGLNVAIGKETITVGKADELSYDHQQLALHFLLRKKILASSPANFDLLAAVGMRSSPIPVISTDAIDGLIVTTESLQYLSLGLGISRILSENWLIELNSYYDSALGDTTSIVAASNIAFLVSLQQKFINQWQLGYGYQYDSLSYTDKSLALEQKISKTTNSFELSIGKGF